MRLFWLWALLLFCQAYGASLEVSYQPKSLFSNQITPITYLLHGNSQNLTPEFDKSSAHKPLFTAPIVTHEANATFYTFYFKAIKDELVVPRLFLRDNLWVDPLHIPTKKLKTKEHPDFCGIIARHLQVRASQVSRYNQTHNLLVVDIDGAEANLEDFYTHYSYEIEHITQEPQQLKARYAILTPRNLTKLKLSYYSLIKNNFEQLLLNTIDYKKTTVGQFDLTTKDDMILYYRDKIIIILGIFFFMMFLAKFDFLYLGVAVVMALSAFWLKKPLPKLTLCKNTPVYILPISSSNIGQKLNRTTEATELSRREGYIKIELPSKAIGWIKDKHVCRP